MIEYKCAICPPIFVYALLTVDLDLKAKSQGQSIERSYINFENNIIYTVHQYSLIQIRKHNPLVI